MIIRRSDIVTSPAFLIGLSLLLVNDFYLKSVFNNTITGKLSDFAGLFVFALFWIALFPQFVRGICVILAVAFAFWKTSYSQPMLDSWNTLGILAISRTVDLTDLIAITILPLVYFCANRKLPVTATQKWGVLSIALVAIFSFTATSYRTHYDDYQKSYYFTGPKTELFRKIDNLHLTYFDQPLSKEEKESGKLELEIPSPMCFNYIDADFEVKEIGNQTVVSITKLQHHCPRHEGDREKLLAEFEREFIERLRTNTPQPKHWEDTR